jgi:hypothetical protein
MIVGSARLVAHAGRLAALAAVVGLYGLAQPPTLSDAERHEMAAQFHFTPTSLPVLQQSDRTLRPVNPSLAKIQAWISSVGAAAALYDLDGTGVANDVCYVDTRTDQVIVAPVPGTGDRHAPFALDPAPLAYDRDTMAPMGCLPGHMQETERADILVYYWGRSPIAFLRTGPGKLGAEAFVPREVVPEHPRWFTNAAIFADLTGSGHADLVVANYFPDGAHILDAHAAEPDEMQAGMPRAYNGGAKHFLLWTSATPGLEPQVAFREVDPGLDPQALHGWTLGLGAADLHGAQLPDLYFANDFGPDRLYSNESHPGELRLVLMHGRKHLTTPNSKTLGRDSFKGMGVDFADIDATGQLSVFVSNITEPYALEESNFLWMPTGEAWDVQNHIAPYADRSESRGVARSGWAWDAKFGDFDNSGRMQIVQTTGFLAGNTNRWPELQELAMGNDEVLRNPLFWPRFRAGDALSDGDHNPFYVQRRDGTFFDLSRDLDLEPADRRYVSRGVAIGDVDGSGRLSFAVANQWADSIFYRNDARVTNSFLGVHVRYPVRVSVPFQVLRGHPDSEHPSRPAISATAIVTLPDGRRMIAEVDGGNGHSGKRAPDLHFGLGQLAPSTPLKVVFGWRDGGPEPCHAEVTLTPGWYTVLLGPQSAQGSP